MPQQLQHQSSSNFIWSLSYWLLPQLPLFKVSGSTFLKTAKRFHAIIAWDQVSWLRSLSKTGTGNKLGHIFKICFYKISSLWCEVKWSHSVISSLQPMDYSLPVSSHGIFQARVLEWVDISFSRGSSLARDQTQVSHIAGTHFTVWATYCLLCWLFSSPWEKFTLIPYHLQILRWFMFSI